MGLLFDGKVTMRVLVTSTPGMGHVHPLVPVGEELNRAGHDVVWATSAEACRRVEQYGFRAIRAGITTAEREREFSERGLDLRSAPPRERRQLMFGTMFGAVTAPRMREDLAPIVDGFRPDLIVHDLAEFAAAPIATARGIPHVTVGFSGALSEALLQPTVEAVADVWRIEGLEVSADAGVYDHLYLHPFPPALGLAPPSARARPARSLGFDGSIAEQPPDWLAAFGIDRPAVYATFGTEVSGLAPWRELLAALGSLPVDAVATIGSQIDPDQIGDNPSNVRVERYVPQSFILERATVLVSHAGAGSMLAAAARGLPQLCIPIRADQWDNADALTNAGAGITLEEDQRDSAAIRAALERLLEDTTFSAAARRVADEIATLPHPETYIETFETLAGY